MAPTTSGNMGVVALWSRYMNLEDMALGSVSITSRSKPPAESLSESLLLVLGGIEDEEKDEGEND
jgi:hypothetical protein